VTGLVIGKRLVSQSSTSLTMAPNRNEPNGLHLPQPDLHETKRLLARRPLP